MAFQRDQAEDPGAAALKKDLASGSLRQLYIFSGEETYLRDRYLAEMRARLLTGGMDDFNFHILQGKDLSIHKLQETIDAMPMMSERTLVVVRDYDIYKGDARAKETMEAILSDLPEYVCLIFLYDTIDYKPDNRQKLAKLVKEKGLSVVFQRQEKEKLVGWVARHFKAAGKQIAPRDAEYLIVRCGDLMTTLEGEIGKVAAFAKGPQISRADIDTVATPQLSAIIFDLTDAVSDGDYDAAFAVLGELLDLQEPPVKLLIQLSKHLRRLYAAKLAQGGKGREWFMEVCEIRWRSQADRFLAAARRTSLDWCRRAVLLCEEADLAMKSTAAGDKETLSDLLLKLSEKKAS